MYNKLNNLLTVDERIYKNKIFSNFTKSNFVPAK